MVACNTLSRDCLKALPFNVFDMTKRQNGYFLIYPVGKNQSIDFIEDQRS